MPVIGCPVCGSKLLLGNSYNELLSCECGWGEATSSVPFGKSQLEPEPLRSIATSTFTVFGVEVKCHVLNDGQRIIEAESVDRLFAQMASNGKIRAPETATDRDVEALAKWMHGG